MDHAQDRRLVEPHDNGVCHDRNGGDTLRLPGEAALAEELVRSKNGDDGFLALLGDDGELHFALLDVKDRVRRVALRKDDLAFAEFGNAAAVADTGEKRFWIECGPALRRHDLTYRTKHTLCDDDFGARANGRAQSTSMEKRSLNRRSTRLDHCRHPDRFLRR